MAIKPDPRSLTDLAAAPGTVTIPALWAALGPEVRRQALALSFGEDRSVRHTLVGLLRKTPRYRAFRPTSFASWSAEQFADALKAPGLLTPDVMQAALIALHVESRRPMLGAFLDAVGVPHTDGVITDLPETLDADRATLLRAADDLAQRFPRDEVILYFLTLVVLEPQFWSGLGEWLERSGSAGS
jgi:hypothetical protein